jgi:2-polyprenyl-6-methoxyphenol hydroxylase-like FAD-dependent oxidoreductase
MMREIDVAIVGGGLAGSLTAAMLGRAGVQAVLVDPHPVYPIDFRCEKLDESQLALLAKTGLSDAILPLTTPDEEVWVARAGGRMERRRSARRGILYDTLVNAARAAIPPGLELVASKAAQISTGPDRQVVALAGGEMIAARLVVLANGLNSALRQGLGFPREDLSLCHSISIGFDLQPVGRARFDFRALTVYPERPADRIAYLTLFPIGAATRANLFTYRDQRDPWLRDMRRSPRETLLGALPILSQFAGEFAVVGDVKIRPIDLYQTPGTGRPGVVLIGDAYATSCPAAGTGANKVLTDVERLCNHHIPRWLASPGMAQEKIAAFYADPVKRACDAQSLAKAYRLRSLSTDVRLSWQALRLGRLMAQRGLGAVRGARGRISSSFPNRPATAGSDSGR